MPRRRPTIKEHGPSAFSAHIGQRLRGRRLHLGFSQTQLAERLQVSFQQVQKYERGANKISVEILLDLASILDVPITYFFEGYAMPSAAPAHSEEETRLQLSLARHFAVLPQPIKQRTVALLSAIAEPYRSGVGDAQDARDD